jgi:HSP20 family protein
MLTLWRPRNELLRWSPVFDSFFNTGWGNGEGVFLSPNVDIQESEDKFTITADLPGVEEKNIELTVKDGVLTIAAHREESKEEEKEGAILRERSYGSFRRSFRLGREVNSEKIEANYKNGVLSVELSKAEEVKPRQIPVSTN